MKTVLIYSGGMDSTVLLYKLLAEGSEVVCLNFDYGSKHNEKERNAARKISKQAGVKLIEVNLPFVNEIFKSALLKSGDAIPEGHYAAPSMKQTVVPGRNTIMLSIAIGYAESIEADRVAIANHAGDHAIYPDCRPEWVSSMSLVAFHGTYNNIKLYAPFTYIDKIQICKLGSELSAPLAQTWTCYKGSDSHCGKCGACTERKEAFEKSGVIDNTEYLE